MRHVAVEVLGQIGRGVQHGMMLGRRGDDVPFALRGGRQQHATDRQIVAFGAATGEDELGRLAVQDGSDTAPGILQRGSGASAETVDAGRIAVRLGPERQHRLHHARIDSGRGRVVKIDHGCSRSGGYLPPHSTPFYRQTTHLTNPLFRDMTGVIYRAASACDNWDAVSMGQAPTFTIKTIYRSRAKCQRTWHVTCKETSYLRDVKPCSKCLPKREALRL